MAQFDLIIRNGEIFDGSGAPPKRGDIAVTDGVIAAIAPHIEGSATEEFDAQGHMLTPGFVDVHTHYDGQATWDSHLNPSSNLGATTVVMGNCGVGFAPCRPQDREVLVQLMEGGRRDSRHSAGGGFALDMGEFPPVSRYPGE